MPHEAIIRAIAVALLALGVLWILAAALGLRPRALRVRHALGRSGPASLLCGACGHPAVSLGTIESCPECGCSYAIAGLDGWATASHWATPVPVLGVILFGVWLLGSVWLAPAAASWANRQTIGSAQLERWQSRLALRATVADLRTGQQVEVIAELDRNLVGPATLAAGASARPALGGVATLQFMHGASVQNATSVWNNDPMSVSAQTRRYMAYSTLGSGGGGAGGPPAPPVAGTMPSPWDSFKKNAPTATLRWPVGSDAWTLTDSMGGPRVRGRGLHAGVSAMAERLGFEAVRTPADPDRPNLAESLALAASGEHTDRLEPILPDGWTRLYFGRFVGIGEITAAPRRVPIHPAAPAGLVLAITTSAVLLAMAVVLLGLSWLVRRRPGTGATIGPAANP